MTADEVKERAYNNKTDLKDDEFGVKKSKGSSITTNGDTVTYDVTEYRTAELMPFNTFSSNNNT